MVTRNDGDKIATVFGRDGKVRYNILGILFKEIVKNGWDQLTTVIVRDVKVNREYSRYIESETMEISWQPWSEEMERSGKDIPDTRYIATPLLPRPRQGGEVRVKTKQHKYGNKNVSLDLNPPLWFVLHSDLFGSLVSYFSFWHVPSIPLVFRKHVPNRKCFCSPR